METKKNTKIYFKMHTISKDCVVLNQFTFS